LQGLDLVHIEMSMPSSIEFIVDLEYPGCDVEILGNELSQRVDEFLLIIYVNTAYWSWHIGKLEDLLRS